jgi:alcohol/geraniol dehydrogenase (NADP+)
VPSISSPDKSIGWSCATAGAPLQPATIALGPLGPQDVEIDVTHCGVCHSDLHLLDDAWKLGAWPLTPGHEVVGTVARRGEQVVGLPLGTRVGVGWQAGACLNCRACRAGFENLCDALRATCVGQPGGFGTRMRADHRFALPIPDGLDSALAAPLLCGGATVFAPLRRHGVGPDARVGIVGIGGLGHLAVQLARQLGAEVTAFTTSPDKRADATSMGAHDVLPTADAAALKGARGRFDLLLVTLHHDLDWDRHLATLRPGGSMVLVGIPPSPISLRAAPLVAGQRTVEGSAIASRSDIQALLQLAAEGGVVPRIERYPMADAVAAVARVRENRSRYRVVLEA